MVMIMKYGRIIWSLGSCVGTNIRMLTLTILWVPFVQGALAQDLTGTTSLALAECLATPAAVLPASAWSFQARPAAFGHVGLSDGAVCFQLPDLHVLSALQGTAGADWTDLHLVLQHRWMITDAFIVGTMTDASWAGARGFASNIGVDLTVHARLLLDPTWSVVCGLDRLLQLHTRFQPPSQALRLGASWEGAVAVSALLSVSAEYGASSALQVTGPLTDALEARGSFTSSPLAVAAAGRLHTTSIPPLTMELRWVADLGLQTSLMVDLP